MRLRHSDARWRGDDISAQWITDAHRVDRVALVTRALHTL